jgi:hypothetical protein
VNEKTDWIDRGLNPVRVGRYEMLNTSSGIVFPVFFNGWIWFHDRKMPPDAAPLPLVRIWPWRGLTERAYLKAVATNQRGGD